MKNLILVFIVATLFSCGNKQAEQPTAPKENVTTVKHPKRPVGFDELSALIGKDNAFKIFDKAGLMESNPKAKGGKSPKANATLAVTEDLSLTGNSAALVYSTSPNAYTGDVQRFGAAPITNDGAIGLWDCLKRWDDTTPPPTINCADTSPVTGQSNYRAFTCDKVTFDVHLSPLLTITN